MNIDEAIDDLYTILGQHNGEYMDYASYEAAVDNLNIISNFVAGTRWIPVSERLPTKEDGDVLAYYEDGTIWSANWSDVVKFSDPKFNNLIVDWMPLPEPPQEVE